MPMSLEHEASLKAATGKKIFVEDNTESPEKNDETLEAVYCVCASCRKTE